MTATTFLVVLALKGSQDRDGCLRHKEGRVFDVVVEKTGLDARTGQGCSGGGVLGG